MTTETHKTIERPPVVVIMGHIDHGKSTLLDYIRKSNVVQKEAGGITQHIAAYEAIHRDKKITFLDTPGHEAFCNVRSRGAKIADVAILIVSAEDGVMPQTKEALNCIKEDNLPYVVAINKIDSPKANVERVKQSLLENEVYLEGYGGNISYVEISAKEGTNISDLLDLILLTAEIEEFKGNAETEADGFVIEAHKDMKKGISATLIIKNGTLKKGMYVSTNCALSPVRSLTNDLGQVVDEMQFSSPVVISGWSDLPQVGADFNSYTDKKDAEEAIKSCVISDNFDLSGVNIQTEHTIPLIIKTDVSGTTEAIIHELKKVQSEEVAFKIIKTGTGSISEADMKLAAGSPGTIIAGFNVGIDTQAEALRERDQIETKTFRIIYELTDWLKSILVLRKPKKIVKEVTGLAKVLKTFNKTKDINVIGMKMKEGEFSLKENVSIIRREEAIGEGVIKELQQQKVKVERISEGEFGAAISSKIDIAEGDKIESFKMKEV